MFHSVPIFAVDENGKQNLSSVETIEVGKDSQYEDVQSRLNNDSTTTTLNDERAIVNSRLW